VSYLLERQVHVNGRRQFDNRPYFIPPAILYDYFV